MAINQHGSFQQQDALDLSPVGSRSDTPVLLTLLCKLLEIPGLLPKHIVNCMHLATILISWQTDGDLPYSQQQQLQFAYDVSQPRQHVSLAAQSCCPQYAN